MAAKVHGSTVVAQVNGVTTREEALKLKGSAVSVRRDALGSPGEGRYYHVDLAFCPLGEGEAMIAPSALTDAGRALLMELVAEPLLLDAEETESFCANSVLVGRTAES